MEISMRIDHGPVQTNTMSYPPRQPQNHRPSHNQAPHSASPADSYKRSRSPLSAAGRHPYPASVQRQPPQSTPQPQLQPQLPTQNVVQRSRPPQQAVSSPAVPPPPHLAAPPPPSLLSASSAPSLLAAPPLLAVPGPSFLPSSAGPSLLPGVYHHDLRSNRISLLPPEYTQGRLRHTIIQPAVLFVEQEHEEQAPPVKRMRLGLDNDEHMQQQLRVDTREPSGPYNPQVENISPTSDLTQDEEPFRSSKDELIQQIGKVDREIAKVESQIGILKKKKAELEQIANKPSAAPEVEEESPRHQSMAQKIYAENKRKAQNAHGQLNTLGPKVDWPLYNQPNDTTVYSENNRKHLVFKRRLLDYLKKRNEEKDARDVYITDTYTKMMQEWLKKVEKIENSAKRKAKEAKNREFFEKVFVELRRQREDKERFNRVGARVKSEADMEEIMDNLQEQALEDKKMRSYAVIPPAMLDARERRLRYQDNNGYLEDMEIVYKSRQFLNVWTPSEKEIFKEKYLQHPKNFGIIASYLDRKSTAECVHYYYLSKKTENYKQLLRKAKQRTRATRNTTTKVNPASTSVVDIMTSGVTTRLQREQQAKTVNQQLRPDSQQPPEPSTSTGSSTTTPPASSMTSATSTATTTTAITSTTNETRTCYSPTYTSMSSAAPTSPTVTTTISSTSADVAPSAACLSTSSPEASMTTSTTTTTTTETPVFATSATQTAGDHASRPYPAEKTFSVNNGVDVKPVIQDIDQNTSNSLIAENKKKKERRKENENSVETSDEEANSVQDKACQGSCAVCQAQLGPQLQSRPLAPCQASQYGLREEQVPPNSRVCNTCRCKSVRSRYTHCPLSTCPNSRGRVKRLRSFPYRLQDLPPDVKEPLLAEFRIPSGVTKCCSACFNRIQRRLGPVEEWPEEDVAKLKSALTELGANWQTIGERLNRTPHQVRSFYAANRKRLNLESCLGDRKPTLTDEEESGSSTSSCEEPIRERSNSSDTASAAESPPVQGSNSNPIKKEDYDSSATETADEAQTPDHYQVSATITPVTNDGQPRQNTSPLSVKDLVLGVIENSFKKTTIPQQPIQNPPTSGMTPTISSILNNDANEVTIVSEYNLNNITAQQQRQQVQQRNDLNLAKLTPLIGATITPVSGPIQTQPMEPLPPSRDDLIVMQVQDGREPETLDLSIKKPREPPPPIMTKHQQQQMQQQQQQQLHRPEQAYIYHQERKSPAFPMRSQPKLPSPKPANPKAGSITLGTPIISQPRGYEGLLRQMPEAKMGSITQGTPIHMPHNMQDKRVYDYFSKARGQIQTQQSQSQQAQYPPQYRSAYAAVDQQLSSQQLSSRQIIMNDYITSQQMLSRRANEKPQYYSANSPHRTPPPPQPGQQQRQGVIQRHTRPQYLQPGHEALSSLVDVAVQQPSLPVPSAPHEGLGKTMADNIMEQPHRYQIIQQHQQQLRQLSQQQRLEEQRRAAYHHQQAQQQQQQQQQVQQQQQQQQQQRQQARTDSSVMTAATLIDAIITHQINQTAEGGRGEVVQNTREQRAGDLLFHKVEASQQQGADNGDRPPSVINVDLDVDAVNKNLTVKELTDSVISHDFSSRQPNYYHLQENMNEQWKRRIQQQQQYKEDKRAQTPQQQQDERQIIRIAQPQQKYHIEQRVEPVSPPENNHWSEQNFRRYQQPQSHISPLDYVKNKIVEVMRTEDDKKEAQEAAHAQDKDRSDSPGDMVIDEEKHENDFGGPQQGQPMQSQGGGFYSYVHKDSTANDTRNNEPKPLLSAKYDPLSDED